MMSQPLLFIGAQQHSSTVGQFTLSDCVQICLRKFRHVCLTATEFRSVLFINLQTPGFTISHTSRFSLPADWPQLVETDTDFPRLGSWVKSGTKKKSFVFLSFRVFSMSTSSSLRTWLHCTKKTGQFNINVRFFSDESDDRNCNRPWFSSELFLFTKMVICIKLWHNVA